MYIETLNSTQKVFSKDTMTSKTLFRIEIGKNGNNLIKAYQNVPSGYTPKEKEFFDFMEAKQCLVSQSGQTYQKAYQQFQYDIKLDEDCCETKEFNELFKGETENVETTTA